MSETLRFGMITLILFQLFLLWFRTKIALLHKRLDERGDHD